jgi:aminoglycoside phosphotransferase family enzyme/predicted kinase
VPTSDKDDPQADVWRLLANPATHGGKEAKRIDTHAASVFLAGERALKVKRAVSFPFLDYSTLDKRKAACEAELAVNRPFAPDVYLRIVPITRAASGHLALDGGGTPVEWAVEMRRFDENATLDHVAERGGIDSALADALGRAVAAAHAAAPAVEGEPWIAALSDFIVQNDAAFRELPDLFPADAVGALTRACRARFARAQPLLARRDDQGRIRRGHGDLHLGNIVLIDSRPVLFDAIEFDPLIAAGDVLYELAFLLMDLVERSMTAQANIVLNRYLSETRHDDDLDGLTALPLFLSVRAAIRAKVTAARLKFADETAQPAIRKSARTYFDLAGRLIDPPAPRLVAVGGLSGTGKSVLARALAPDLPPAPGAVVLRSDVERKTMFGKSETEPLPSDAYTDEVTARVYASLADKTRRVVAAGHSAIVDAVFAKPEQRQALAEMAGKAGLALTGLFLVADLATRIARVGHRVRDASDADAAIAREQEDYALGVTDWTTVDASGSPAETLAAARRAIDAG